MRMKEKFKKSATRRASRENALIKALRARERERGLRESRISKEEENGDEELFGESFDWIHIHKLEEEEERIFHRV
jgi:hypothetical protein